MKLATALKEKNKLTKKIAETQKLLDAHNSVIKGNTRPFDIATLFEEWEMHTKKLIELKTKITLANQSIMGRILNIGELRSQIAFLRKLSTKSGIVSEGYRNVNSEYDAKYSEADIKNFIDKKEIELEKLQEEIDQYNHTVELPE